MKGILVLAMGLLVLSCQDAVDTAKVAVEKVSPGGSGGELQGANTIYVRIESLSGKIPYNPENAVILPSVSNTEFHKDFRSSPRLPYEVSYRSTYDGIGGAAPGFPLRYIIMDEAEEVWYDDLKITLRVTTPGGKTVEATNMNNIDRSTALIYFKDLQ